MEEFIDKNITENSTKKSFMYLVSEFHKIVKFHKIVTISPVTTIISKFIALFMEKSLLPKNQMNTMLWLTKLPHEDPTLDTEQPINHRHGPHTDRLKDTEEPNIFYLWDFTRTIYHTFYIEKYIICHGNLTSKYNCTKTCMVSDKWIKMKAIKSETMRSTNLIGILKFLNVITFILLISYLIRETIHNNTREANNYTFESTVAGYTNFNTNTTESLWKYFGLHPKKSFLKDYDICDNPNDTYQIYSDLNQGCGSSASYNDYAIACHNRNCNEYNLQINNMEEDDLGDPIILNMNNEDLFTKTYHYLKKASPRIIDLSNDIT
ncbi:hypothetical protein RF11_07651 [Thelohanellus kitauei]|uniref:Uncharacterized protein n=1 Tax=Thelohanellus kitauei TaxID=669202 RepID=A0A0C2IPD2_THEKT|nr:hypothetical protein RF11_07651 [Thelohanellus kitauei]